MPTSAQRSTYEQALSVAHRALWRASQRAEEHGDEGAVEDLAQVMQAVSVLMSDSLKNKRRPRRQLAILDS